MGRFTPPVAQRAVSLLTRSLSANALAFCLRVFMHLAWCALLGSWEIPSVEDSHMNLVEAGKNPTQRTRTSRPGPRPRSGKAARPAKRSWTPQELLICAHTATYGAKSRRKQASARNCTADCFYSCLAHKHMICMRFVSLA